MSKTDNEAIGHIIPKNQSFFAYSLIQMLYESHTFQSTHEKTSSCNKYILLHVFRIHKIGYNEKSLARKKDAMQGLRKCESIHNAYFMI